MLLVLRVVSASMNFSATPRGERRGAFTNFGFSVEMDGSDHLDLKKGRSF
jgi:hypothetical protein